MCYVKSFVVLVCFSILTSCGKKEEASSADTTATEVGTGYVASSAAKEPENESQRKFIRTADLKFRVKNVEKSTYNIEDITRHFGGFVTYTNLETTISNVDLIKLSKDSSLETTHFEVKNHITIRVPNTKLDTTLKVIAQNIDFLDYRIIKAEDVALDILSNKLTQNRNSQSGSKLLTEIDQKGRKLKETNDALENVEYKQEKYDNAKIANLSLMDKVMFSTIDIQIYQRDQVKNVVLPNLKNIEEYEPNFFLKLWDSIKTGCNWLENVVLFVTQFWAVILSLLALYIVFKRYILKWFNKI
ncbi:MAG: DUF4349 domain-containing protein [Cytophagales bacterium]